MLGHLLGSPCIYYVDSTAAVDMLESLV